MAGSTMAGSTENLIIGAGPYGLSLAAYLRAGRADFRIIGSPMAPWRTAMPADMFLKSEGFASTLFEPSKRFTLGAYCAEQGLPYADIGEPVKLDTFIAYGTAFQRRLVPNLEDRLAVHVQQTGGGFEVRCADGDTIRARRLIMASGILHFAHIPAELHGLPAELVSHSADHRDLSRFKGQDVVVIGAGASAMDVAASLRHAGARATVIARRSSVRFQTPLGERSLLDRIRAPMTAVGPGWKSVFCTQAPLLFHCMSDRFRTDVVRRYLGPAPGWFTREQVEGHVPVMTGTTISAIRQVGARVELTLAGANHQNGKITADHVIAATGFKVDVDRLDFLDTRLRQRIDRVDGFPRLSRKFESSVPDLYFIGLASANSFGPMVRFAAGAGFTARRLARVLGVSRSRDRTATIMPNPANAVPADN